MTQGNKPREFWIDEEESIFSDYAATYYKIDKNKYIHVIQYSAYQAEREKVRRLVNKIKEIDAQNDDRCWYNVERLCKEAIQETEEV